MKKLFSLVLTVVFLFGLQNVCVGAEGGKISIAYATVVTDHPFWRSQLGTIQDLAKEADYDLNVYDAGNDPQKQVNQVDTIITTEPDVVIFTAVDTAVGGTLVEKIQKAGIPVVVLIRIVEGGNPGISVLVGNVAVGKGAGDYILAALKKKYGEPKGVYLELQGDLADASVGMFDEGFHGVLDEHSAITGVIKPTKWDLGLASAAAEDVLATRDDIDAIWLMSDYFIPAVKEIIMQHSALVGEEGHIIVVGDSADSNALDGIREGWMDASINMPVNDAAEMAFEYAVILANGEKLSAGPVERAGAPWSPAEIIETDNGLYLEIPPWPVDASNADDSNLWGNKYRLE